MSWWTNKRDRAEAAAKKSAQESLDAVNGMDANEKAALWTVVAVAVAVCGALFVVWRLLH